ncbi:MAG: hypothetical protein F4Y02_15435 [Chloroflexi bacterium]|nr:hypothetical protein [Chloroflexota bacterium]
MACLASFAIGGTMNLCQEIRRRCAVIAVAIAILMPGATLAQSICEGLTDILTMLEREDDGLQFYTVPGAMCEWDEMDEFACIWQQPGPGGRGPVYLRWLQTTIHPDMKKLAGAIQQCIRQEAIPYKWGKFERDMLDRDIVDGYFVQLDDEEEEEDLLTISVCYEANDDVVGSGILLKIHKSDKGDNYCWW